MPPRAPLHASPRRPLPFSRLRTAHDCTMRDLVHTSWDASCDSVSATAEAPSWRRALRRASPSSAQAAAAASPARTLPPRSATDVSGAALHAARVAEAAAREAADASAAARAAAAYARQLADSRPELRLDRAPRPDRSENANGTTTITTTSAAAGAAGSPRPPRDDSTVDEFPETAPIVMPVPVRVPLGKVWSYDVVALWHNAIRLDMTDLLDILDGMANRRPRSPVTLHEMRALFAWFSTFEAFVVTALKAEEEVLFPWLEQWGRIDGELSTASRITTKGAIIRGVRDTAACAALLGLDKDLPSGMVLTNPHRHYYDGLKVGYAEVAPSVAELADGNLCSNVLRKVCDHVAAFSTALLDYFHEQERSLPVIIDSLYDAEDMFAASIERRMLRALWKCGRKDESVIMLVRAVEESPTGRQWLVRNLRRFERVALPLWRRRYNSARGAVVAKFRERKRHWERSAASLDMQPGPGIYRMNNRNPSTARSTPPQLSTPFYSLSHATSFENSSSSSDTAFPSANGT